MPDREQIEDFHQKYLFLRENTPMMHRDGEECKAYHKWYDNAYVYFKSFDYLQNDPDYQIFINAPKDGNCFVLEQIYDSISPSYKVLMLKTGNMLQSSDEASIAKTTKIFISHCGADIKAVSALVDLLGEVINLSDENLFCSSVHGFDVMVGKNFMDNIMEQYNNHELFLLYVLSHNYMNSPICLNEMGASWMTRKDSIGILLPGFDIEDLGNSCYDKQSISVIFNQGDTEVKHRLNQFKETIERLFPSEVKSINWSRWEEKRDEFIAKIMALPIAKKKDNIAEVNSSDEIEIKPKASIESSVYYRGKGSYVITFTNRGVSPAENIYVDFDDVEDIIIMLEKGLFPIEILKPGRGFQVNAVMMEGAPHKLMSRIRWKEADKEFEEEELVFFNE